MSVAEPVWSHLRISAQSRIEWPGVCPCCLRTADSRLELSYTRLDGIRVIKAATKTWAIPYCQRCIGHAQLINAADELTSEITKLRHEAREQQGLAESLLKKAVLSIAVAAGIVILAMIGFAQSPDGKYHGASYAIILLIGAGVSAYFLVMRNDISIKAANLLRDARRAESDKYDLAQQAQDGCIPSCSCIGAAAVYSGWDHSVQSFAFASAEYAKRVQAANRGKVIS
jgi:hypothetical protein